MQKWKYKEEINETELNEIMTELETPTQEELRRALEQSDANDLTTTEEQ